MIKKIEGIFREILDDDQIVLKNETNAEDIEDWDSLNHVYLIVAIEKEFGVKFNSSEIQKFRNIGGIVECIETKL